MTHRRYVPYSHAHYAGNLVDGAYGLGLFGDVATELCILTDGDEGLFASYADVQFRAPVRAGDVVEVDREADPGRHPVARHGVHADRCGAGRGDVRPARRRRRARPAVGRDDGDRHRRRSLTPVHRRVASDTPTRGEIFRNFEPVGPRSDLRIRASAQVSGRLTLTASVAKVRAVARAGRGRWTDVRVTGTGGVAPTPPVTGSRRSVRSSRATRKGRTPPRQHLGTGSRSEIGVVRRWVRPFRFRLRAVAADASLAARIPPPSGRSRLGLCSPAS